MQLLLDKQVQFSLESPRVKVDVGTVFKTTKTIYMDGRKRVIYDNIPTVDLSGSELTMLTLVDLPAYIPTCTLDHPKNPCTRYWKRCQRV
ncbi:hypothetical protein KEM48_005821 [Puccinia striiformis f. sp. tritici PST-130]|nr:hypothetical protein KEM48_005821 [Puccinia striiformis f. sp. tritici PST-130]